MKEMKVNENNRFHAARQEISKIGREEHSDIGVACLKWAEKNCAESDYSDELNEFLAFVTALQTEQGGTAVRKYFEG